MKRRRCRAAGVENVQHRRQGSRQLLDEGRITEDWVMKRIGLALVWSAADRFDGMSRKCRRLEPRRGESARVVRLVLP